MRLLALLLLLAGCEFAETYGPDAQGYTWRFVGPPTSPVVHVVPDGNIMLHCGLEPNAMACSVRRGDVCDVYVPTGAPTWLLEHEKRHCAGWVH